MSNQLYVAFKEKSLSGSNVDFENDDIRAILIDSADYTYGAAHDFLDDVPAGARVAVSSALTSKTITNGVFDSADFTLPNVTGDPSEAVVLYKHTGVDSTSPLILYMDTGITGIPVTPNSGSIDVNVNASGWFSM